MRKIAIAPLAFLGSALAFHTFGSALQGGIEGYSSEGNTKQKVMRGVDKGLQSFFNPSEIATSLVGAGTGKVLSAGAKALPMLGKLPGVGLAADIGGYTLGQSGASKVIKGDQASQEEGKGIYSRYLGG